MDKHKHWTHLFHRGFYHFCDRILDNIFFENWFYFCLEIYEREDEKKNIIWMILIKKIEDFVYREILLFWFEYNILSLTAKTIFWVNEILNSIEFFVHFFLK